MKEKNTVHGGARWWVSPIKQLSCRWDWHFVVKVSKS